MTAVQKTEKLSKLNINVISFLSGVGIICIGTLGGIYIHPAWAWVMAHSTLVLKAAAAAMIYPAIRLCGWPVQDVLQGK